MPQIHLRIERGFRLPRRIGFPIPGEKTVEIRIGAKREPCVIDNRRSYLFICLVTIGTDHAE